MLGGSVPESSWKFSVNSVASWGLQTAEQVISCRRAEDDWQLALASGH